MSLSIDFDVVDNLDNTNQSSNRFLGHLFLVVGRQPTTQQQDALLALAPDLSGREVGIVVQAVVRRRHDGAAPRHTVTVLVRKRHHVALRDHPDNLQVCDRLGVQRLPQRLGVQEKRTAGKPVSSTRQNHDHAQNIILDRSAWAVNNPHERGCDFARAKPPRVFPRLGQRESPWHFDSQADLRYPKLDDRHRAATVDHDTFRWSPRTSNWAGGTASNPRSHSIPEGKHGSRGRAMRKDTTARDEANLGRSQTRAYGL